MFRWWDRVFGGLHFYRNTLVYPALNSVSHHKPYLDTVFLYSKCWVAVFCNGPSWPVPFRAFILCRCITLGILNRPGLSGMLKRFHSLLKCTLFFPFIILSIPSHYLFSCLSLSCFHLPTSVSLSLILNSHLPPFTLFHYFIRGKMNGHSRLWNWKGDKLTESAWIQTWKSNDTEC